MQAEHSSGTRHLLPNTWVVQAPLVDEHDQVLQPVFETSIHHAGDNRIHWYRGLPGASAKIDISRTGIRTHITQNIIIFVPATPLVWTTRHTI